LRDNEEMRDLHGYLPIGKKEEEADKAKEHCAIL
jgi:hypothetical protein